MSDLLSRLFPEGTVARPKAVLSGVGKDASLRATTGGAGLSNTATDLSTRWRSILTLELKGHTQVQIAQILQMSAMGVMNIIHDPRYRTYRDNYLAEMDEEFFAMKPLAFDALRGGLRSSDENTALRAAEQWFKGASFGGFSKTPAPSTDLTAEDVARQLLSVHAENVQVNITHNHPTPDSKEE